MLARFVICLFDTLALVANLTWMLQVARLEQSKGLLIRADLFMIGRIALAPTLINSIYLTTMSSAFNLPYLISTSLFYLVLGSGIWVFARWAIVAQAFLSLANALLLLSPSNRLLLRVNEYSNHLSWLFPLFIAVHFGLAVKCVQMLIRGR